MDENLDIIRHSTSHLMAQAVRDLFPGVKVAIGPSIETGFYYDFDYEPGFTEEDLAKIEKRMHEIAAMNIPIERKVLKRRTRSPCSPKWANLTKWNSLRPSPTTK